MDATGPTRLDATAQTHLVRAGEVTPTGLDRVGRTTPMTEVHKRMRFLRESLRIIRVDLGAYVILNVIIYGVFLAGFAAALVFPELTAARLASLEDDGTADLVRSLISNVWMFALVILGVNTITVGALSILLPSLIVPFVGIAVLAYRMLTIGLSLAPTSAEAWVTLIPHSLTVVIELQAYVLLALGAYLLGRYWLRPATIGAANRRQGYVRGLQQIGWLSLPALILLVVGAIYEAFSLIYLVPVLVQALI